MTTPAYLYGSAKALRREVLKDAPRGYWPCDEQSGTAIADISGNGYGLTITGSNYVRGAFPFFRDGVGYLRITGSGTYGFRSGTLGLTPPLSGDHTGMWMSFTGTPGAVEFKALSISANGETSATNHQVQFGFAANQAHQFWWERGTGADLGVTGPLAPRYSQVRICHVVKDITNSLARFYMDGRLLAEKAITNADCDGGSSTNTHLGNDATTSPTRGVLGHVAFFSGVCLTPERIMAHAVAAGRMLPT